MRCVRTDAERDQPRRAGFRRGHGGGQLDRRSGEHLPTPADGKASLLRGRPRRERWKCGGRCWLQHADHGGGLRTDRLHPGGGRAALRRHRFGDQLRRRMLSPAWCRSTVIPSLSAKILGLRAPMETQARPDGTSAGSGASPGSPGRSASTGGMVGASSTGCSDLLTPSAWSWSA